MGVPLISRTDSNPMGELLTSKQVYTLSHLTKIKLESCDERNTWDWLQPAHAPINSEFDRRFHHTQVENTLAGLTLRWK